MDGDGSGLAYAPEVLTRIVREHLAPSTDVARRFSLRRVEAIASTYLLSIEGQEGRTSLEMVTRKRQRLAAELLDLLPDREDAADVGDPLAIERIKADLADLHREWSITLEGLPPAAKRGRKEKLARRAAISSLAAVWADFHGPARRQVDKETDREAGPFLAFVGDCLRPIDPAACKGLGEAVRSVLTPRRRRAGENSAHSSESPPPTGS